jgi:hypothetical protein
MAKKPRKRKPGPRVAWYEQTRYQRARCIERLKPNQVASLSTADAFARWIGRPLNCFVTVKFLETVDARPAFETAIDRLSKWHRRWGGEWFAIHVWEAIGGYHVHIACHRPKQSNVIDAAIRHAFEGHDVDIRKRVAGQGMLAYLCKGTDVVTHARLRGTSSIRAKRQGIIPWKRCGTTQNIGKAAQTRAGFGTRLEQNNCAKTSPRELNASAGQRTMSNSNDDRERASPTYVVSQVLKNELQSSHKNSFRQRVASGDLDASRHAVPEPFDAPGPVRQHGPMGDESNDGRNPIKSPRTTPRQRETNALPQRVLQSRCGMGKARQVKSVDVF